MDVRRGDDVLLGCVVFSFFLGNIIWILKGKILEFLDKYEFLDDIYIFKVKEVMFEDVGFYECFFMNELGEVCVNVIFIVGCKYY